MQPIHLAEDAGLNERASAAVALLVTLAAERDALSPECREKLAAACALAGALEGAGEALIVARLRTEHLQAIQRFLMTPGAQGSGRWNTHGPLSVEKLASMLLEDVARMMREPRSVEAHNMSQLLSDHGYL